MRFAFDPAKSRKLRADPDRGIGFEEAQILFDFAYYDDRLSEVPPQFQATGWVNGKLYTLIYEIRQDLQGEYLWLVTLWQATREERKHYAEYWR